MNKYIIFIFILFTANFSFAQNLENFRLKNEDRIQPWKEDPKYWQYKEKPVLLLGGSKTDHIFLVEGLKEHLEEIKQAGGNYVRNTPVGKFKIPPIKGGSVVTISAPYKGGWVAAITRN